MNDRELLELAADGAGINWIAWSPDKRDDASLCLAPNGKIWNPLKYDADAFRLMVDLRFRVTYVPRDPDIPKRPHGILVRPFSLHSVYWQAPVKWVVEYNEDLHAAARRAITRAAAEMGKERK